MKSIVRADFPCEEYVDALSWTAGSSVRADEIVPVCDNFSFMELKVRGWQSVSLHSNEAIFVFDSSSVRPSLEALYITYPESEAFEDLGVTEVDMDVRMAPVMEWTARIRIEGVERKGPSPLKPDLYEQ